MVEITQVIRQSAVLMKILLVLITVYLVFSAIMPSMTLTAEIDSVFSLIFGHIPAGIFTFISDISEWLRNSIGDSTSGVGTAVLFIGMMLSIALSFAIPLLYYAIVLTLIVICMVDLFGSKSNKGKKDE